MSNKPLATVVDDGSKTTLACGDRYMSVAHGGALSKQIAASVKLGQFAAENCSGYDIKVPSVPNAAPSGKAAAR